MNLFRLTEKVIIITGASSGIGRQCAITCSKFGAKVALLGRNEERLKETLSYMDNAELHVICSIDLTNVENVPNVIKDIVSKLGRVDGLINCAGISTTLPLKMMTEEKILDFFSTNVFSSFNITKEVVRLANFSKDGGSVIFLSSIMALVGESGKCLYSATKGALLSGAKSLACELAKRKIRVNTISPGAIETDINKNLPHMADPEKRAALEAHHLLGLGKTDDIANACVYLLSDASRWVTGTNLVVDGGYTAK